MADALQCQEQSLLVVSGKQSLQLLLGIVQLGLLGITANLPDDHLLDEIVLLLQLVALEIDLALHGLMFSALALHLLLHVLDGDVVVIL